MLPEELAEKHPKLYHITEAGASENIKTIGLHSTKSLLELFEIEPEKKELLKSQRRAQPIHIEHATYGKAVLNDNTPLLEKALTSCLEPPLTVADWMQILNSRVFFWPSEEDLNHHLNARLNRGRMKDVLVIDTLSLLQKYQEKVELCPINSGVTFRKAARRGIDTFTPLLKYSYKEWSHLRGKKDQVKEVTVVGAILDINDHIIDVIQVRPSDQMAAKC